MNKEDKLFIELGYYKLEPYPKKKHRTLVSFRDKEGRYQIVIDTIDGSVIKWDLPYSLAYKNGDLFMPDLAHPEITKEEREAINYFNSQYPNVKENYFKELEALENAQKGLNELMDISNIMELKHPNIVMVFSNIESNINKAREALTPPTADEIVKQALSDKDREVEQKIKNNDFNEQCDDWKGKIVTTTNDESLTLLTNELLKYQSKLDKIEKIKIIVNDKYIYKSNMTKISKISQILGDDTNE